ncbi:MAG: prepilin-type N-terminal cleavage/methylation domain-containing protein, partial [Gemmatimonadota bacterium]
MNRSRDGFTLVELLVVMVLVTMLSAVVGRVMINGLRVSQAQMVQAGLQSNVRVGGLVVPLELREIGYDSNITTNAVPSDIEVMGNDHLQFRAMRGFGLTCGTPLLTELRIRKPAMSYRPPRLNDGFLFFVENDPNTGLDDQWIPLAVTAIDYNSLCGADSAIALTMGIPEVAPMVNLALSQVFIGGPIRFFERMRFGAFVDADGQSYLGARSVSLGEGNYRAVAGP